MSLEDSLKPDLRTPAYQGENLGHPLSTEESGELRTLDSHAPDVILLKILIVIAVGFK